VETGTFVLDMESSSPVIKKARDHFGCGFFLMIEVTASYATGHDLIKSPGVGGRALDGLEPSGAWVFPCPSIRSSLSCRHGELRERGWK
jgi:hypothetical protein